ncbi:MAG: T9SS type A sorting domain-containing protein [bacterium]|nr:T9SS type A sorting domain-containing protein [bacterium]
MKLSLRCLPLLLVFSIYLPVYSQYNWEPANGPFGGTVTALGSTPNGSLLAVTENGLFRANSSAQAWTNYGYIGWEFHDFQFANGVTYALLRNNDINTVYRSLNNGAVWETCNLTTTSVNPLLVVPDGRVFCNQNGLLVASRDSGITWDTIAQPPIDVSEKYWLGGVTNDTTVQVLLYTYRNSQSILYRATDGNQWDSLTTVAWRMRAQDMAVVFRDTIYGSFSNLQYRSVDHGITWVRPNISMSNVVSMAVSSDRHLYLVLYNSVYYFSRLPIDDFSANWQQVGSNSIDYRAVLASEHTVNVYAASNYYGVFKVGESLPYNTGLSGSHAKRFAGTARDTLFSLYSGMVFRSSNNGNSWTRITPMGRQHRCFTLANDGVMLAGASNALYRSTDGGLNWQYVTSIGGSGMSVVEKAPNGTLYGISNGLMKSTDNGIVWSRVAYVTEEVLSLGFTETGGILGGTAHGIYYSNGAYGSWSYRSLSALEIRGFAHDTSGAIYAACVDPVGTGSRGGLYKSDDNGATWRQLSPNQSVYALATNYEGQIFFSTATTIYRMQPNGGYQPFTNGLPANVTATCFFLHPISGKLFMGTPRNGTFRTAQMITGVSESESQRKQLPVSLKANYPNPFNTQTKLIFAMPYPGNVSVNVYDITGAEVANLFSGKWHPGYQTVVWSPGNLTSGIYFCRLESERNIVIHKLTYLK